MNENQENQEETLGEKRMRTLFNPGNNDKVQNLKEKFAHLFNDVQKLRGEGEISGEQARLISLAQTDLESACMWAVRAATF